MTRLILQRDIPRTVRLGSEQHRECERLLRVREQVLYEAPETSEEHAEHRRRLDEIDRELALVDRVPRLELFNFNARHLARIAQPLDETPALAAVRSYVDDAAAGRVLLFLLGGTGTGKTLATHWHAFNHGGSAPGLLTASALAQFGLYDKVLPKWLAERTSLAVDDLGVEYADKSGVFATIFDSLIDDFYSSGRMLIVTSNLSRDAIRDRYGERVMSRLAEAGRLIKTGAVDKRREAKPMPVKAADLPHIPDDPSSLTADDIGRMADELREQEKVDDDRGGEW